MAETMKYEDGVDEAETDRGAGHYRGTDCHDPKSSRLDERRVLCTTKPSYKLNLCQRSFRSKHRDRLSYLLNKLVRQRDWGEAGGVLSVLLQGTCNDNSPARNGKKYWVTMEVLKHIASGHINQTKFKHIYEIWMRKNGLMKTYPIEDRCTLQLEFIIFFLMQGNVEEAHQAAICLMQQPEFGRDPVSNMVVGLTFYQLWYSSSVPKEIQLKNSDEIDTPMQSEMTLGGSFNDLINNSEGHTVADIHHPNPSFQYDSDTSVRNDKNISADIHVQQEVPVEDKNFSSQGFYMGSVDNSGSEEVSLSNQGDNIPCESIFHSHCLDAWLLPLRFPPSNEDSEGSMEEPICLPREVFNDYYKGALKYLRLALHSTPPLFASLLPLVQLLLIGGQIEEALKELEKLCQISNTALPFRLKASLLERFDSNNFFALSTCYEDILKKDPTCSHSLARLIGMHQKGEYDVEALLEMIALYLDAAYADYITWKEFSLCFLKLFVVEEDRRSMCLNGDDDESKQSDSFCFTKIPKIFTEGRSGNSWKFRCKWWLNRHFSMRTLTSEIAEGNLELVTYKAACALYLYGGQLEYVLNAVSYVEDESRGMLNVLKSHMMNQLEIYSNPKMAKQDGDCPRCSSRLCMHGKAKETYMPEEEKTKKRKKSRSNKRGTHSVLPPVPEETKLQVEEVTLAVAVAVVPPLATILG